MSRTVDEVISDIFSKMKDNERRTVKYTESRNLIQYLHSWGRKIRNEYNLWYDKDLLASTGEEHPDDASMLIMKRVWQMLQETDVPLNPECPSIQTSYNRQDWGIPYTPICEDCGLPYYFARASECWVHPFYIDGKWIGLESQ